MAAHVSFPVGGPRNAEEQGAVNGTKRLLLS